MLSRELVIYSRFVWRKRVRLQYSVFLAMLAGLLLLSAYYLS